MTTISPTNHVQAAILTAIKADAAVTAIIPAARLYPSKTPATPVKPFGRYGAESVIPFRASCWRGGSVTGSYHLWVGQSDAIPDPKVTCGLAVAAVADVLDALDDCYVGQTQLLEDGEEPDLWHGVVQFTYEAIGEA